MFNSNEMPKFSKNRHREIGSRYARLHGKSGAVYFVTEVSAQSISTFRNCVLVAERRGAVVGVWHSDRERAFVSGTSPLSDVEAQLGAGIRWFMYFLGNQKPDVTGDLIPERFQYAKDIGSELKMAA